MSMTVTELREALEQLEAEGHGQKKAMFNYTYGDHWRTQVAVPIDEVAVSNVEYSEYHGKYKVIDEDDDVPKDAKEVVLIG